ncbi:MAG: hypothetical protein HY644_04510 [Acidobacteria bacterium]|nr:hypothetical protein [Acidobacteriota bacterium]
MNLGQEGHIPVRLALPDSFPHGVPSVFVNRDDLQRRIPHVEKTGKICVAPSVGVLLDSENPDGIVRDALERARCTLQNGLAGTNLGDFKKEFLSYWGGEETVLAGCNVSGPARPISFFRFERRREGEKSLTNWLLVDGSGAGEKLVRQLGGVITDRQESFFLPLAQPFDPPDFDQVLSAQEALVTIQSNCSEDTWTSLQEWLRNRLLPAVVLLAMPIDQGWVLFAVLFDKPLSQARRAVFRGFRPKSVTATRELQFSKSQAVKRINIDRYIPLFYCRGVAQWKFFGRKPLRLSGVVRLVPTYASDWLLSDWDILI